MLLQRLVDYARANNVGQAFHKEREFTWRLELSSTGAAPELVGIREPNARGKLAGQRHVTPAVTRTVGVAAQLGADDVQYVLGWGDEKTKPTRVAQCHEEFVALISRWAQCSPEDPVAEVVRKFYASGGVSRLIRPEAIGAKEGVLIAVDGIPVIKQDSLVRFWADEVAARKGGGTSGVCLVCGNVGVLLDTVPGNISKRLVPGAANNAALVSVNARVFGYALTTGLEHTPICFFCGDAMNAALTHLLSGPHTFGLQQQDSAMTWWTLGKPPEDFFQVMPDRPDPDAVGRVLAQLRNGRLARADQTAQTATPDRFCSVSLGGNSSRIVIRDWIDQPLQDILFNLARWYDDHQTCTLWDDEPVSYGLYQLALATGRWDKDRVRYFPLDAKGADRPEHIQRDLQRTSLRAVPLPPSVLHHVLHRIATDGRIDGPRAALLRLALRRHPDKEIAMPAELDDTNHDPAYVLGRVFAVYEKIQYNANRSPRSGGNGNNSDSGENGKAESQSLNAGFGDRFYAGAITNPRPAMIAGERLAKAWLSKIRRRPGGTGAGLVYVFNTELSELLDRIGDIPARFNPAQQAQFVLGYHHQRAHDAAQRRKPKTGTDA
ncbi:type I-C CRISPR-associated protein Cas8c/Csd1 [Saccharopolyspora hirsuta]|uniref:Type I-C CRISPR-associated protein Cas8c/Csd1 n=1 Tax=Saccharopolyspora hirsuta TaxID=1837 RepID=A0A5M7CE27_SACHI|nr:type I-C CRISPR-associated protein Cas8c/Csd1 [Saccharopolyspora hirsuta]KAA5837941.1 type I-C CRISPR-associated protein Cas8c/Csd1 [Saccharopolyspora hirsuta]